MLWDVKYDLRGRPSPYRDQVGDHPLAPRYNHIRVGR
jgi:hypothetical protein